MKKQNAFTLIELLVVIAIIAVLVAMLAPAVAKFLESGRAKEDANNLKSIGQGIQMYLNDHDNSFFSEDAEDDDVWPKALKKRYVPDWKAFRSPFDKVSNIRPKKEEDPIPISYGLNLNMMKEKKTFTGKWTAPPSSLVMAAPAVDVAWAGKDVRFRTDAFSTTNLTIEPTNSGGQYGTHNARYEINVLMFDGHIENMLYEKYSDGQSERGLERWYPMGKDDKDK